MDTTNPPQNTYDLTKASSFNIALTINPIPTAKIKTESKVVNNLEITFFLFNGSHLHNDPLNESVLYDMVWTVLIAKLRWKKDFSMLILKTKFRLSQLGVVSNVDIEIQANIISTNEPIVYTKKNQSDEPVRRQYP